MTLRSNLATVVACVLIPLGLASPSPAAGERKPLAKLIGGAKAEVRATQALSTKGEGVVPPGVARFPLRWRPDVDAADVRAVLRDVHHGDWRDQELAGHFEPRLEDTDGTAVLLVEIDRAPPVERGTYALVVDLIGPATKELPSGERDELNLEIVLSAAEIKTSPAITLQKLGETAETAALRTAASKFQDAVEAADGSGEVLEVVRDSHWDLDTSLREAILAQVPDGQDRDEIEAELGQGQYAAVLRRLLLDRGSSHARYDLAPSSAAGEAHAPDLLELFRRLWKGRSRSRSAPVVGSGAPIASPGFPAIDPVLTWWSLLAVRLLQSGLALVVITAAGYFLFEEEWTGTWRQMLGIVAWGFGLDLGLDKAMEVAGPVHKPSA